MNTNLINIQDNKLNNELVKTVNARELHTVLANNRQFTNWIQERISEFGFVEGQDFLTKLLKTPSGGRPSREYYISLDMAKELSMVERNEKGKQARQYFIACEKKAKQSLLTKDTSFLPEFRKARALTMITNVAEHICSRFPNLGIQSQQVVYASLLNPVAGDNVVPLPILEHRTYSATEVGQKLGISSTMVGRIANKLNLKNEQYGIFVLDKSPHSDKQVEVFRYNDKAVEKIAEELKNLNESEGQ